MPDGRTINITLEDWVNLNEQVYRVLREKGWKPEDARQFLPIGTRTEIIVTTNVREWRHIFKLRCAPDAHWEIRLLMVQLLKEVKERLRPIFDDFEIAPDESYAVLKGSS